MVPHVPPYFDHLIDGFHRGDGGRFVHLGYWDDVPSSDWTPAAGEFERAQEKLNETLLEMAALRDGQAVLDVGCGFGGTIVSINERHRDMRLVGVNIDPRQLEISSTVDPRNGNAVEWREADACALPFADGKFDRVLCIEAMFHFASRRRFFEEAARMLPAGGVLVASDIVVAEGAREEAAESGIVAALQDGFGPWPDPWADEGTHSEHAAAVGLVVDRLENVAVNTRPSHEFTMPGGADERGEGLNPMQNAARTLKRLHDEDHLAYLYLRLSKP